MLDYKLFYSLAYNVLYIDNPVGTGFSFTKDDKGLSTTEAEVADNLFEGLRQFFALFNEYKDNRFFISGESYAGKYIPALGFRIHTAPKADVNFNFAGVAIGDGFTDPSVQSQYAQLLYQIGKIPLIS